VFLLGTASMGGNLALYTIGSAVSRPGRDANHSPVCSVEG
jgi:hypothetical protein